MRFHGNKSVVDLKRWTYEMVYESNNNRFINPPCLTKVQMLRVFRPILSKNMLKIANSSHPPCKTNACMLTTCETSMCKHIYNPSGNTRSLFLPLIATLVAKIPREENKREMKKKKNNVETKRRKERMREGMTK